MKALAFITFILTILLLSPVKVHAFWNQEDTSNSFSITVGEWIFSTVWEPNQTYEEGDVVFWNGQFWQRNDRGSGSNQEPNTSPPGRNFWILLD